MEIKIYTTFELTESLWHLIVDGFNQSFVGANTTIDNLKAVYRANTFGYSYHAICFDGHKLVGFNTIYPSYYNYYESKILIGFSGSTFVVPEYRKDISILRNMFNVLKEHCLALNFVAFIGVPNENSYMYFLKILRFKEVQSLSYYILPIKISKIMKKTSLSFLDLFFGFYSISILLFNYLMSVLWNTKEQKVTCHISFDDDFLNCRFSSNRYKKIAKGDKEAWYRVIEENGIRTAYLMDFRQQGKKTFRSLWYAVWSIYKNEKIDLIMYVGTLNLKQMLLIKVPLKYEPKRLPLICLILKNPELYKNMEISGNWDFSLLNFDVK